MIDGLCKNDIFQIPLIHFIIKEELYKQLSEAVVLRYSLMHQHAHMLKKAYDNLLIFNWHNVYHVQHLSLVCWHANIC